ncbi:MAG: hypothetical protein ACRDPT_06370 [Streptomycetales bacterium]
MPLGVEQHVRLLRGDMGQHDGVVGVPGRPASGLVESPSIVESTQVDGLPPRKSCGFGERHPESTSMARDCVVHELFDLGNVRTRLIDKPPRAQLAIE